jgi:hypothetical protein
MEPEPARKERRGRKRKRNDVRNGSVEGQVSKKQLNENNPEPELIALVGRYVKKSFEDSGVFLGKVVYYESGLYRIDYEDGDCEDLESSEIRRILMKSEDFDSKFNTKRKKLDAKVSKKYAKGKDALHRKENESNIADKVEASSFSGGNGVSSVKFQNDNDDHSDTSSDSCETSCDRNMTSEAESPVVPPPNLPPSSGSIRVPEEYVSHLFSVYSFLRSFSIGLYLSPFGLDEFVGSLNCSVPNTLLDAIHVAVMRALRRHLETQSSDQSELASKCLRCMDWSLLDTLTWPVYAVQYLMIMGYTDGHEWKGFCKDALVKDYYNLPASRKLTVLQILCDDALDSAELRADIEMRVESELGTDTDGVEISVPAPGPRRVHPRYSKTSACKDQETVNAIEKSEIKMSFDSGGDVDNDDGNGDECRLCGMDGTLLCCDGCPSAYHLRCIGVSKVSIPDGSWFCPECSINKLGPKISDGTSLRGAQVFGIDPYEHVFLGSCNHLLVLKGSTNFGQCVRYYNQKDISVVLQSLCTSVEHITMYSDICLGISKHWEIPESFLTSLSKTVEVDAESSINNAALEVLKPSITQNSSYRVYPKDSIFTGSSFKTQAYFNNYTHGDFAATASANFAIVSSEENRVNETLAPNSHHAKKLMSASIQLQVKAFSSAANRFFWPSFEKKHVEVPRERCGWCLSCKASNNKRGCLLNSAASNAIKGSIKILSGLRPVKNCDESLPSIATYVMFMEECLCGLTFGPFLSLEFRKQWRKQVEQASTCTDVKTLLLQLEQHIHTIALSSEWVKLVDNLSAEASANQSVTSVIGSIQKRGPGRKRGRKKANAVPDNAAAEDSQDVPTGFAWWRGGMLSKHILQKGTLPLSLLKKLARQSGSKKSPGIFYSEALEIPRRTRQMVWRATVEMSKTASQLAVQVRYLDHHIRWSDLVRLDQNFEGKGADFEAASAFRNAFICDKRIGEKKTTYGLFFKNQKHLPTRVMKNVLEVEQCESGEDKYWFSETYIPLYLVKEYEEEKVKKGISSMSEVSTEINAKPASVLSKLQKKQLKLSRKNVFLYLSKKKDNLHTCFCAACQRDVLIRNVVKCGECQGYCHEQCTISTPIGMNGMNAEVEYSIVCKECRKPKIKPISQTEIHNKDSPTSPLFIQHQEIHSAPTIVKKRKHIGSNNNNNNSPLPILPVAGNIQRCSSEMKPGPTSTNNSGLSVNRSKIKSWGLIWKKKDDESGIDFRIKNLMLKNNPNRVLHPPECFICHKKYDPSLMYLRCDSCDKWYHAEALELEESKIYDLVGFKCCKCRRIRSPLCPYMSANDRLMMLNSKKTQKRNSKKSTSLTVVPAPSQQQPEQKTWVIDSGAGSAKLPVTKFRIKTSRDSSVQENNHNHFPHPGIEQVTELKVDSEVELNNNSCQKLPVRRQPHILESSTGNLLDEPNTKDESLNFDWDNNIAPTNGFDDNLMFDYENFNLEDMEFEPQTYFSFTELLANDENGQVDGVDQSTEDVMATWDNNINNNNISNTNDIDKVGPPIVPCSFCSKVDPCPDLSCQICGSWVHSQCSPLDVDESFWEGGWRCINCREWR